MKQQINGENPPVQGITFVQDLQPYIERKLYTVNTGHSIVAYLGYLAGIRGIHEALANVEIKTLTEKVLKETGKLLIAKYNFNEKEHNDYIQKILGRFANPFISDDMTRVGRSPVRKLKSNDRLVGPAMQYMDLFGEVPRYLTTGIAAALRYDYEEDPDAMLIQETDSTKRYPPCN